MKERMALYVEKYFHDKSFKTGTWPRKYGIEVMFCVYELFGRGGGRKSISKEQMQEAYRLRKEILNAKEGGKAND